jgi:subtilisin family serine protease
MKALPLAAALASLAAAVLLGGCAGVPWPAERPRQGLERQIIVTLADTDEGRAVALARELQIAHPLEAAGQFPLASIGVQCLVYRVADGASIDATIRRLQADPRVESVQVNQGFDSRGSAGTGVRAAAAADVRIVYSLAAIHADAAQRIASGRGVTVAVIDTGIDSAHPDLRERIVARANFVENGDRSFTSDRHGTAVAGVIAARAGDGAAALGVAPQSTIAALKACWHEGANGAARCSSWTIARALDHAIGAAYPVLNLSLAGPPDALIARLLARAEAGGITVIAAAAEREDGAGFPASFDTVIAVAASDAQGRVRSRGRAQPQAPLAAPGVDVLSTVPGAGYDFLSGSSIAAAHVSGVVALLLQQSPPPDPRMVRQILRTTAQQPSAGSGDGIAVIDACRALNVARGRPVCSAPGGG